MRAFHDETRYETMKQARSPLSRSSLTLLLALAAFGVASITACDAQSQAAVAVDPAGARAAAPSHREVIARGGVLLDVRTPGEFASGHVAGALNIPVDELARRAAELPADKPVVIYCRSGRRSAVAAELLRAQGRSVIDIGPMSAW